MKSRILTNNGISIDLDAITCDQQGIDLIKAYVDGQHAKRKEQAFANLQDVLSGNASINRALATMEPFRGVESTQNYNFLFSNEYIPSQHLELNAPRIYNELVNAFGEEWCRDNNFTLEVLGEGRASKAHRVAVILQSAIFEVQSKYMLDDLPLQLVINEVFIENLDLHKQANTLLRSCQLPITVDKVFANRADEISVVAGNAITRIENTLYLWKVLKYAAISLAIVLGAALLGFAISVSSGLLAVPLAMMITAYAVGGAVVAGSGVGLGINIHNDKKSVNEDSNLNTPVVAKKPQRFPASTGTPSNAGTFAHSAKGAEDELSSTPRNDGKRA